jgi:hypothetical protein
MARRPKVPRFLLSAFFQLGEDQLGYFAQGLEDAGSGDGNGFGDRLALNLKLLAELLDGEDAGKVALIELQDVRNGARQLPRTMPTVT